jgi:hypothetical protein
MVDKLTKVQALNLGYCDNCAARYMDRWLCGIWQGDLIHCMLPAEVVARREAELQPKRRMSDGKGYFKAKAKRGSR